MRFQKTPLDFTVHLEKPWNDIKKQYAKHISELLMDCEGGAVRLVGAEDYPLYQHLMADLYFFAKRTLETKIVWAFDVIESQIDPGTFLRELWYSMRNVDDAQLFITCPYRSWVATWSFNHWHEIEPNRFKYIADYCGFKVVREKHVTIHKPWYFPFTGIRPLLRTLFSPYKMGIYELRLK